MLTVVSGSATRDCEGFSRRDFLRIGACTLGGLTLADLLAARAAGAETGYVRDKSIVLLYLSGGASHIETFDPKMSAPAEIRSMTGECATNLPGVSFGGTFPRLAARADRLAVIRSFMHPVGSHEQAHLHVLSGGTDPTGIGQAGFSMGSLYARLRGANHPVTGMPSYALLTENEVDGQYSKELGRVIAGSWPGELGSSYAPFQHQTAGDAGGGRGRRKVENPAAENMTLQLPPQRFEDRRLLLAQLDRLRASHDARGGMEGVDAFRRQAMQLVLGGAAEAFDFRAEDPRLIAAYDTSEQRIGFKTFRPSTLGHQMLTARRLCEAGCGFVTVHSAGWDMHADGNNPGILTGMEMLGRTLDKAVSAFLDDVAERGLSEKILLVITGDFGRTPKVNARGGRDHWARLGTLAFAGGGLPMGQVIGESARGADVPATEPITTSHLLGTLMHTVFDTGQLRLDSGIPRELLSLIENSRPIAELG